MHLPHASVTQPTWSLCCCLVARSRRAGGFTLHCIDTPSLLDQDNVSDAVRCRLLLLLLLLLLMMMNC